MMRRLMAALGALAVLFAVSATSVAQAPPPAPTPPAGSKCAKPWQHDRHARYVVRFTARGGDYHALPITKRGVRLLGIMRSCARHAGQHKAYRKELHYWRHRMVTWRFYRHIDEITPYGKWAIPPYIVFRESHGFICAANPASTAGGYYQMIDSTWYGAGGRSGWGRYYNGFDHPAACAPAWMQHEAAARLWRGGAGSSHWAKTR